MLTTNEQQNSVVMSEAFAAFLSYTPDAAYVVSADLRCMCASTAFAAFVGLSSSAQMIGQAIGDVYPGSAFMKEQAELDALLIQTGKEPAMQQYQAEDASGAMRSLLVSRFALRDENGAVAAALCVMRDVTQPICAQNNYLKEVEYLLNNQDKLYVAWLLDLTQWRLIKTHMPNGVCPGIAHHETIDDLVRVALEATVEDEEAYRFFQSFSRDSLFELYQSGMRRRDFEYRHIMLDATRSWVHLSVRLLVEPASDHLMAILLLTDIDHVKTAHDELVMAAEIDSMTGVFNHDATLANITRFLKEEGASGTHALFMIDRDGLKQINDTLGHKTGDEIIVETARALLSVFRDNDIVGRVGGDEFLVLMKNAGKLKNIRRKAVELLQSLQYICGSADNAIETTGSIGISIYSGDQKTLDKLYAEADTALYRAKADGRNRCVIYSADAAEGPLLADGQDSPLDTVNLKTLLNSIDGGILILRTEAGKPLLPMFFSDSFLVMMGGLTQKEAFALYGNGLLASIHPDDRTRVESEYAAALESGEPLRTTYRLLGKNNAYCWLSAGTSIIRNADGKIDIYAVHTNIEKLMHHEEKLASDEMRYRMAFSQTSRLLWELNLASDELSFFSKDDKQHLQKAVVVGLPEALIDSGFIHPASADAFRDFYAIIRTGKSEDKALLNCRFTGDSAYTWASVSYQMVFDAQGAPIKAIGSIEELPNISRSQARLAREERLMHAAQDDLLFSMKANLAKNEICILHADEANCFASLSREAYSTAIEDVMHAVPYSEDGMLLQLNLSRENLIEAHAQGKAWSYAEFRRIDNGEIRWTKISACLIEDTVSRELYVFLYAGDVEKRRSVESVLPITTERDQKAHLYTQKTTERLLQSLMRSGGASDRLYSLALIRMRGLPALSARIGSENVDLEQMYLGRFLCILLDCDCIVGLYGNDSFLVFCPDSQSDAWMCERIATVLQRVDAVRSQDDTNTHIELICGVSTERARNATLSGMLSQAARICDTHKHEDADSVHSFSQYVDSFRISDEALKKSMFVPIESEELSRPLFGEEREVMLQCMSAMLAADRYDVSATGALGVIGQYYQAQRVYTLSLLSGNVAVAGMHEWVAPGKHGTLRQISGMTLDRLPMFKRALAAAKPIIINGRERNDATRHIDDAPWRFIILPIIHEGKVQGFLCIENPKAHYADVALPHALIPILLHERARFGVNAAGMRIAGRDELTGLPDHSAYNSAMQAFNPDAYHAVGAFYIAVANLRELNREKGVAFGDDMLAFVAQTLVDSIRKAQAYRMSGTEFVVICTNLSREAFQGSCARVQGILQRRYPKLLCFGAAWSDRNISARKLVSDAEGLAHNGMEKTHASISKPRKEEESINDILDSLANGKFFVLMQPQVDMRTGMVTGAEALARCMDASDRVILPNEFIHLLEDVGRIRELDYFVLDQTFRHLQEWISHGLMTIPISVNFSRQTLRSSTVLASSLAIRSRYDVPEYLVEIEVTESLGKYDPDYLRKTMDSMNKQGFHFVLDDLGSEYSSLKTIGDFSFVTIKLDKSLIDNFLYNTMSRSVVESIVGVCAKNNIKCVAEGVMSSEQVKGLLEVGCVYAQGYYFGKPMLPADFCARYLKKR